MQNVVDIRSELAARAAAEGDEATARGLDKVATFTRLAAALDEALAILTNYTLDGNDERAAVAARTVRDLTGTMLAVEASIRPTPVEPPNLYPLIETNPDTLERIARHVAATLDNRGVQLEEAQAIGRDVAATVRDLAIGGDE